MLWAVPCVGVGPARNLWTYQRKIAANNQDFRKGKRGDLNHTMPNRSRWEFWPAHLSFPQKGRYWQVSKKSASGDDTGSKRIKVQSISKFKVYQCSRHIKVQGISRFKAYQGSKHIKVPSRGWSENKVNKNWHKKRTFKKSWHIKEADTRNADKNKGSIP